MTILLKTIEINQFKNHSLLSIGFESQFTIITGDNGFGKTNLLDAVHFLSFTKSYFNHPDKSCAEKNTLGYRIKGLVKRGKEEKEIIIRFEQSSVKKIYVEGQQKKPKEMIGVLPMIFVGPEDTEIVKGSGVFRRNFIDKLISQSDDNFFDCASKYQKILKQRNHYLKNTSSIAIQESLLNVFDEQLDLVGDVIYQKRKATLQVLQPLIKRYVQQISSGSDDVEMEYYSDVSDELKKRDRQKDIITQRTNYGVHRDDILLTMKNDLSYRIFGSQGQVKTLLIALHLAASDYLQEYISIPPMLIFDDFLSKFDQKRVEYLFKEVFSKRSNQTLITDTQKERLTTLFQNYSLGFQSVEL